MILMMFFFVVKLVSERRFDAFLYCQETYGNDASDSSDDEEWTNTAATRTRKNRAENTTLVLGVSTTAGTDSLGNPRKRGRPKANPQVARGTQVQLQDSSPKTSFAGSSRMKRTEYNKLGGEVTKVFWCIYIL